MFINDAYLKATEDPSSTTQTESEQSSTSMVTTTNVNKSKTGRRQQPTKRFAPAENKQSNTRRRLNKSRYTADEVKREKAKLTFKDVEFQLNMTHIEFVDLISRPPDKPAPKFDLMNHTALKGKSEYWIGYADKKAKILLPEFLTDAIITEDCQTKIFSEAWVDNVKKNLKNTKLVLSHQIRGNIEQFARDSCYHPDDQIVEVRYQFSSRLNKHVWQGKTEGNKIETLTNEWFELNIQYPLNNFYVEQLEYMTFSNELTHPWVHLPIGSSFEQSKRSNKKDKNMVPGSTKKTRKVHKLGLSTKVGLTNKKTKRKNDLCDTSESSSNSNSDSSSDSNSDVGSESNSESDSNSNNDSGHVFKYKQSTYGEVCTLINIINIFNFMNYDEFFGYRVVSQPSVT